MIVVRFRRRFQIHGHAIPMVNVIHMMSPSVHAGFVTDRPTFRTSSGFSPTAHLPIAGHRTLSA